MRISVFDNCFDGVAKQVETTWDGLVAGHVIGVGAHGFGFTRKDDLPAFSPAEYQVGAARLKDNVQRVHFGVLDLDKVSAASLARVIEKLAGLDAILYTTWSHPALHRERGVWCVRIIVRLSRAVEMVEWATFWPSLVARFDAPADPQCKDPCRIYYGAFSPPGTHPHACSFVVFKGAPLDVAALPVAMFGRPRSTATLEKITRERLATVARTWKRSKAENRQHLGEALGKLVKGEPFAEIGAVDTTIFQLAKDLIKTWPNADPASLAAHFEQSIQLMGTSPHTVEDVTRKIERAQEEVHASLAAQEFAQVAETKLRMREAFATTEVDRDWAYTGDEIRAIARGINASPDELRKRWMIQRGPAFYLLAPGGYSLPYTAHDVMSGVLRDLAPARVAGVDLMMTSPAGEPMRKSLGKLMEDYGSVAQTHVLDFRAQKTQYDASQKLLTEACSPRRLITPRFDHQVHQWLYLLSGERFHELCSWIALVTDLDSTCAALLLTGPGSAGKGCLAYGLARIWTTNNPTTLVQSMGAFNAAMARCPLIFADEQLPKDHRGHGRTSELREFIAARSRPYTVKHMSDATILGAVRVMVAANNEDVLSVQENLSRSDISAIADRFLHIRVPEYSGVESPLSWAGDYLASIDGESFVLDDRIATHALWLRDNYPVKKEGRFLIKGGSQADTIRALTTKGGIRSAVCQWLVGYLKNPTRVDARGDFLVRVLDGELLVNVQGLIDCWDTYVQEPIPSVGRLSMAVSNLSRDRKHRPTPRGGSHQYRVIDKGHLYSWGEMTELATREDIDRALSRETGVVGQRGPVLSLN